MTNDLTEGKQGISECLIKSIWGSAHLVIGLRRSVNLLFLFFTQRTAVGPDLRNDGSSLFLRNMAKWL